MADILNNLYAVVSKRIKTYGAVAGVLLALLGLYEKREDVVQIYDEWWWATRGYVRENETIVSLKAQLYALRIDAAIRHVKDDSALLELDQADLLKNPDSSPTKREITFLQARIAKNKDFIKKASTHGDDNSSEENK